MKKKLRNYFSKNTLFFHIFQKQTNHFWFFAVDWCTSAWQNNGDVFKTHLNDGVYEQIKDFNRRKLTEEQKSLIDKLILDEDLKNNYKEYGLCKKCKQPKNSDWWCRLCVFQQNFQNWTSGNNIVDKFIQKIQLKATKPMKY